MLNAAKVENISIVLETAKRIESFEKPERGDRKIARKLNGSKAEDIAQLPQLIEVSGFSFSPIHNFVPQTGAKFIGYDVKKGREGQDQIKGLITLPAPQKRGHAWRKHFKIEQSKFSDSKGSLF